MKESNGSIKSFIREILVVVIGILIALFINNWNEHIQHQKFIDKTLYAIGKEISQSKGEIESILPKHYRIISSLHKSIDPSNDSIKDVIEKADGFQIPEIKDIALRFFISNSAELVDYEIISDLSEIEFIKKGFEMHVVRLTDLIYTNMDNTAKENKIKVANILTELTNSEEDLVELYENFISKNKNKLSRSISQ